MIKVIIVDDEKRILKLIEKLIQWEKLGLQIVGKANDGIEAIDLIKEKKPNIVITDIRMPGYDGLEMIERARNIDENLQFIIISGYEQFEYAKKAIEFGVKDYLLKPINKEKLIKTLINVKKHIKKNIDIEIIKKDVNLIRVSFLNNVLFKNEGLNNTNIYKINEKYHFSFIEKYFNVVLFKIDYNTKLYSDITVMNTKIVNIIKENLKLGVNECEIITNKNNIYLILNYKLKQLENIEILIQQVHQKIIEYIIGIKNFQVTIAYGSQVEKINDLNISFNSSNSLIEDRILYGKNRIYKYNEVLPIKKEVEDIFYIFFKRFIKYVEMLDYAKIEYSFMKFKQDISNMPLRGINLKDFFQELFKAYYLVLKNNKFKNNNLNKEHKEIKSIIDNSDSIDGLFSDSLQYLLEDINSITKKSFQNNMIEIIKAKEFIEKNYMENIKLEDVGNYIGFNPSYFSSVFKKETGTSFVEYLSMVRVEKAKELLKESDLKIQDISSMIGYNDSKYFTKTFIKYSGLKPNEYRKLFV